MNKNFLILVVLISNLFSQENNQNINFIFANNGYGFGYEYENYIKSNLSVGVDLRLYDVRNDEYPIYDPYYNQFQVAGEKDILLFPILFRANYYLFDGKIANSFRPYLLFSIGPLVAVDADENISSFKDKWSSTNSQTSLAGSFGFGVNFTSPSISNTISLGFGYDHFQLAEPFHGKKDFGGGFIYLKYQINRE